MKKTYVLDTSTCIHDGYALDAFGDNEVVLPAIVLVELDRNKHKFNARKTIQRIAEFRTSGNIVQGVPTNGGGIFRIEMKHDDPNELPTNFNVTNDLLVLLTAMYLRNQRRGERVIVVSKDVTIWTLGDLLGVEVQDYTKDQTRPVDELLQGCVDITTSKEVIDLLYENEVVRVNGDAGLLSQAARTLAPNACCRLIASIFGKEKTALVVYKQVLSEFRDHIQDSPVSAGFRLVRKPDKHEKIGHLGPRNEEQSLALELLDDDDIKLVILAGKAGTGKSLLAFATGIKKVVIKKMYDRLIVVRPTIEAGVKGGVGGLGFIPGTLEEKLEPWMNAAADCISFALNGSGVTLSDLVRDGRVILKSVHHDRGITSRRSFVVIDEGQNLDPTTTKMMLTRPDDETKVVLTGDPYQIDNPHLGPQSNGLARALEDLPGHPLVGALTLRQCVRGELAAYVADKYSL